MSRLAASEPQPLWWKAQEAISNHDCGSRSTWLQSRRMKRATNQQTLISTVFDAAKRATESLTHLVPDLDRDRAEYAVASVLLDEAWVAQR